MKKLITFSSFFALLVLFLAGCQNSSNITSPENNFDKPTPPSVYVYDCDTTPISVDDTASVDLIAGQNNPVGIATFIWTGTQLKINYELNQPGTITEVHIDFATTKNNDANNGGFHANSQGSPQPGHFDINTTASGASWNTTVSKDDLLNFLNLPSGSDVDHFYIAAHGVVNYGTCPTLPIGEWRYLPNLNGVNYYIENVTLYDENSQGSPVILSGLNGWCVDRGRSALDNTWYSSLVQVDFVCSYGEDLHCYLDKPENIGAVNWLLNNKTYAGTPSLYDIQVTIWKLISNNNDFSHYTGFYDPARVNTLYEEALNHTNFVPSCGQIIGELMIQTGVDYCSPLSTNAMQVMLIERTVECSGSDTMWGFNFDDGAPVSGESCRFVDPGNWARYFQF